MISVILPVVDEWSQLARALESVLLQDFNVYEVLIRVDGGAPVPDVPVFSNKKIRWLSGPRVGLAGSLNIMAGESKGGLLVRLDADDVMLPGRLGRQYDLWLKNPGALVAGYARILNPDGSSHLRGEVRFDVFTFRLALGNPIVHSAVAMDASIFQKLNGYDIKMELAQDYDLWTRWALAAPVILHEDVVCEYLHKVNREKMARQMMLALPCVRRILPDRWRKLGDHELLDLIRFSGGVFDCSRAHFLESMKTYRGIARDFPSPDIAPWVEMEWPYLLGRNLSFNRKLDVMTRLSTLVSCPRILKAYPLRSII